SGQHLVDPLVQVRRLLAKEARVFVDRLSDLVERPLIVGVRAQAQPILREVDAVDLLALDGAADVGAEPADAGDGAEVATGPLGDADDLPVPGAGSGHPERK